MATLSGQTIQSTYQGLLKLADSTTGITSSFQQIQDGLGDDTGIQIKQGEFDAPNLFRLRPMKGKYYGNGFVTGTAAPVANQNMIVALPFTDMGIYSYSAVTVSLRTQTTTSDTIEFAFYKPQMTSQGIMPGEVIISGITASTTGIALKTFVFPNSINFSGTPGLNFFVSKISNSGVAPTVRFGSTALQLTASIVFSDYGYVNNFDGTTAVLPFRSLGSTTTLTYSGISTFDVSYNASDLVSKQSSTLQSPSIGFILHTI